MPHLQTDVSGKGSDLGIQEAKTLQPNPLVGLKANATLKEGQNRVLQEGERQARVVAATLLL